MRLDTFDILQRNSAFQAYSSVFTVQVVLNSYQSVWGLHWGMAYPTRYYVLAGFNTLYM